MLLLFFPPLNTTNNSLPAKLKTSKILVLSRLSLLRVFLLLLTPYLTSLYTFQSSQHQHGFQFLVLCFECPAIMLRQELVGSNKPVGDMRSGSWGLRVCLGAAVLFGVIWLFFIGILANHATTTTTTTVKVASTEIFRDRKLIQREKLHVHQDLNLHYVSKRRVPNGPDPIHNRYVHISLSFNLHIHILPLSCWKNV